MKRLRNFRKGDFAEALGVTMLKSFCAVAEVPRQEDFGLVDAVATLLRIDGQFVYAEDTFSVQFKSRTEDTVEYFDLRLNALLDQEISTMIARVDAKTGTIELHTLGIALANPNVNDLKGIILHLPPSKNRGDGPHNDILHVNLTSPILRWTTLDCENKAFCSNAYTVMKSWLTLERSNRKTRQLGMASQFKWNTNEVPTIHTQSYIYNPAVEKESLASAAPAITILARRAADCPELRRPVLSLLDFFETKGVEVDPLHLARQMINVMDVRERLEKAMLTSIDADVSFIFVVTDFNVEAIDFWMYSRGRDGAVGGQRFTGTPDDILPKGFAVDLQSAGDNTPISISLTEQWLTERGFKSLPAVEQDVPHPACNFSSVGLLKRVPNNAS